VTVRIVTEAELAEVASWRHVRCTNLPACGAWLRYTEDDVRSAREFRAARRFVVCPACGAERGLGLRPLSEEEAS
jgi:hypothetical protein